MLSSEASAQNFAERNGITLTARLPNMRTDDPTSVERRQTRLLPLHRSWWGPRNTAAAFSLSAQIGKDEPPR